MECLSLEKIPRWAREIIEIQALIETWARAYDVPREEIIRQVYEAYAWCESNRKMAPKTRITRFLFTFMKRAKQYGNLVAKRRDNTYKETATQDDMTLEEMKAIREKNLGPLRGHQPNE